MHHACIVFLILVALGLDVALCSHKNGADDNDAVHDGGKVNGEVCGALAIDQKSVLV
jgi:hypothetical protein